MSTVFGAGPPQPEGRHVPLNESRRPSAEAATFEDNNSSGRGHTAEVAHSQVPPSSPAQVLRRQRQVVALHRLGARATFELLDELDRRHRLGEDLDERLARYAAIEPSVLRAIGGDRFPPNPTRGVR